MEEKILSYQSKNIIQEKRNKMNNLTKIFSNLLTIIVIIVLALSIKGNIGNPDKGTVNDDYWIADGPFESSNERGRFALTYSLIEDKSVKYALPIAQFSTPDLAYMNGEFMSLFAPGVSFISIPGYLIGEAFNTSQVGAFATISLFALLNTFLIAKIAGRLGADPLSSKIASLIFLFATPAFSYATTMYQHHISVFLILISIFSLLSYGDLLNLVIVLFLYSVGISVDYPNALLMAPVVIYSFARLFKRRVIDREVIRIDFNFIKPFALIAIIPPLIFFFWFNKTSYDSPFRLAGTVPRAVGIEDGRPLFYSDSLDKQIGEDELEKLDEKTSLGFFETRRIINGLNVHLFSSDRGILYYTPVMLLGIIGMIILGKRKNIGVFWAIAGVNLILYSLWGDPWGGWSFGSRYLIPLYAILSIFIPFVFYRLRKDLFLISIVFVLISYSVAVNSLGALTSTANPPKIEAQELAAVSGKEHKYTYERNFDLLIDNSSRSFIYNNYLKNSMYVWEYYLAVTLIILLGFMLSLSYLTLFQPDEPNPIIRRKGKI